MTKKLPDGTVVIEVTPPETCSRCGSARECRDVRGDGKPVCHRCATPEDLEAYGLRLFGGGNG